MDPRAADPTSLALVEVLKQPRIDFNAPAPEKRDGMDWTSTDTALQAGVGLSMLLDYLQTRQIVRDGHEANPIIGKHGERVRPEIYFPAAFLASALAAKMLPPEWRNALQGGLIGMQGATVARNWANAGRNPFK